MHFICSYVSYETKCNCGSVSIKFSNGAPECNSHTLSVQKTLFHIQFQVCCGGIFARYIQHSRPKYV